MAPHSSILAWEIPWTEEPGSCSPQDCKESDKLSKLSMHAVIKKRSRKGKNNLGVRGTVGEGNGTPSSTLVWKIPWTEQPGRLQSMGSLRVGHD